MGKILEVTGLAKSYGSIRAVRGISFYVEEGGLFAFLGPNGAGKSTTIDMLCTLLQKDGGEALIAGHVLGREDHKIRREIGVVFQDSLLDPLLTVRENLITRGSFYGMGKKQLEEAIGAASKAAAVEEFIDRRYGKLSGGQRRRADIARALLNRPRILFLDEPTTGLDPQTRVSIWETIRSLQAQHGTTIFLTTHYMEEAAGADYVLIIDDGQIAAKGTPGELRGRYSSDVLSIQPRSWEQMEAFLARESIAYERKGDAARIRVEDTLAALPILDGCRDNIARFEVIGGSMDDAFIAVTGKEMRG